MDDYLTKPLTLDRLRQAIAHWAMSQTDEPAIDRSIVQRMFDGNERAVARVLTRFKDVGRPDDGRDRGSARSDRERLAELAHKLKGAARAAGAMALGELAARVEKSGRSADVDALQMEWHRVAAELAG